MKNHKSSIKVTGIVSDLFKITNVTSTRGLNFADNKFSLEDKKTSSNTKNLIQSDLLSDIFVAFSTGEVLSGILYTIFYIVEVERNNNKKIVKWHESLDSAEKYFESKLSSLAMIQIEMTKAKASLPEGTWHVPQKILAKTLIIKNYKGNSSFDILPSSLTR